MKAGRYLIELLGLILAYGVVLVASLATLPHVGNEAVRVVVTLAPMLPAVLIVGVVMRQLRRIDELQRRIQFEALAFAFAGIAVLSFGYGFLENVGYPRLSMFVVWPVMAGLWIVGLVIGRLRYR